MTRIFSSVPAAPASQRNSSTTTFEEACAEASKRVLSEPELKVAAAALAVDASYVSLRQELFGAANRQAPAFVSTLDDLQSVNVPAGSVSPTERGPLALNATLIGAFLLRYRQHLADKNTVKHLTGLLDGAFAAAHTETPDTLSNQGPTTVLSELPASFQATRPPSSMVAVRVEAARPADTPPVEERFVELHATVAAIAGEQLILTGMQGHYREIDGKQHSGPIDTSHLPVGTHVFKIREYVNTLDREVDRRQGELTVVIRPRDIEPALRRRLLADPAALVTQTYDYGAYEAAAYLGVDRMSRHPLLDWRDRDGPLINLMISAEDPNMAYLERVVTQDGFELLPREKWVRRYHEVK